MKIGKANASENPSPANFPKNATSSSLGKMRRHSFSLIECSSAPSLRQRKAIAPLDLERSQEEDIKTLQEFSQLKEDFDAFIKESEEMNEDFSKGIDQLMEEFEQISSLEEMPMPPLQALNPQVENLQASVNEIHSKLQEIQEGIKKTESLIKIQPKALKPPLASKKPPTVFETATKIASIALPILAGGAIIAGALFFLSKPR